MISVCQEAQSALQQAIDRIDKATDDPNRLVAKTIVDCADAICRQLAKSEWEVRKSIPE